MKVTFDHSERQASNIITFWFKPPQPIRYEAGQFIEMFLPHPNPDERGIKRWFTLSSAPTDAPLIAITTKFAIPSSSFKNTLKDLKKGDPVEIIEPMGDFILPKDAAIPLVFVAGGIGITPFHSIIRYLSDKKEHRDIYFLYAIHSPKEQIFNKLLSSYPLKKYQVLAQRSDAHWQGEKGLLNAQKILEFIDELSNKLIYISGPEMMVEKFNADLLKLGVPKSQLVGDYFPNYSEI
jgi:glycine betaine catabolism B